ncbi:IQ-domain 20 [Striga hermonthica]|uniref:IQ-domain 20 n=1 Tax=Striga hermonthica TaxID=68872 RepID=A0A9N7RMU5_STRHE|nr:IQ-domain 20 [Striga hermonthica]
MARNKNCLLWMAIRRIKLLRATRPTSQNQDSTTVFHIVHTNNGSFGCEDFNSTSNCTTPQEEARDDNACLDFTYREDHAAIAIQTWFRGHLARRGYRALRSLVKLQAVVRGVVVRRQARIALHCMHALARLQVIVHARWAATHQQLITGD